MFNTKINLLSIFLIILSIQNGFSEVSQYSEQFITMPEIWNIEGVDYQIRGTVITGGSLFTVHAYLDHLPVQDDFNEEIANKIAKYSVESGYLENTIKYTSYNEPITMRENMVAVALIKILDEKEGKIAGAKFAFTIDELYGQPISLPHFPLPASFTESERVKLKNRLMEISESRFFDDMYTLYCDDALDDINLEEDKIKTRVELSLAKEIRFEGDDFTVYLGNKGGRRGFHHYVPIKIKPAADESIEIDSFFQILLIDDINEIKIYGISLNFSDPDDLRIFYGKGDEIQFDVLKD